MYRCTERFTTVARPLVAAVAFALALTGPSAAQDEVAFPETPSGAWEGLLDFRGYFTIDSVSPDGAFTVKISDVIGSTQITLDLTVDEEGLVYGTMAVDLTWFDESAGAAANGDPFHVLTDHHQTGTLVVTGTAARLEAWGTLEYETLTDAGGGVIEEVSGSKPEDVEWVFSVGTVDCYLVGADLIEASGRSLLNSSMLPQGFIDAGSGSTYFNALLAGLVLHPKSPVPPPEAVSEALDEVFGASDELRTREAPDPILFMVLVDAWTALQAELAALDRCQAEQTFWLPEADRAWLVNTIRGSLETALESPGSYDAGDLIDLYDVGTNQDAIGSDLKIAFIDAFNDELNEAIAGGDRATVEALAAFFAANGFLTLQEKAEAAL